VEAVAKILWDSLRTPVPWESACKVNQREKMDQARAVLGYLDSGWITRYEGAAFEPGHTLLHQLSPGMPAHGVMLGKGDQYRIQTKCGSTGEEATG
jgi:hypothetical protein